MEVKLHTIDEVLKEKIHGLYYGSRVLLPFSVDILKAIIDNDILTDFSSASDGAYYEKFDNFTEIYFFDHEDILNDVSKYETIKMIVVEDGNDLFDFKNHRRISLNPIEGHKLEIEEVDDEIVFIE
jgi:hypothetical protein